MSKKRNIQPVSKKRVLKDCHSDKKELPGMLRFNETDLYPNNNQCPECNGDMFDDRSRVLNVSPPEFRTYCKSCHYSSQRVVS